MITSPQRLQDVVGNQNLVRLIARTRVPNSALFAGPDGIGKKTVALLLARLANCHSPVHNDVCGYCPACRKAAGGNHPDILLYPEEGESSIKIAAMRHLSREAQYRPFEGKARFFVVDQAERMTLEAANSILKTLEEPPATSHLLLLSGYPERLLSTIRSRCQTLFFRRLPTEAVSDHLKRHTELDQPDLRARLASGSIGRALSLDLEDTLHWRARLTELLRAWSRRRNFSPVFTFTDQVDVASQIRKREIAAAWLEILQTLAYDLYFIQSGTSERLINIDQQGPLSELAVTFSLEEIRDLLGRITEAKFDLERNVSPQMCFETLWLQRGNRELNPVY